MTEDLSNLAGYLFLEKDRNQNSPFYDMLNASVLKINDHKLDGKMFNSIIITGGNSLTRDFVVSVKDKVKSLNEAYNLNSKVFSFPTETITNNSVWIGGSIFACIDNFLQFYISKAEYTEFGDSIIERKLL